MTDLQFPDSELRRSGLSRPDVRDIGGRWTSATDEQREDLLRIVRLPARDIADAAYDWPDDTEEETPEQAQARETAERDEADARTRAEQEASDAVKAAEAADLDPRPDPVDAPRSQPLAPTSEPASAPGGEPVAPPSAEPGSAAEPAPGTNEAAEIEKDGTPMGEPTTAATLADHLDTYISADAYVDDHPEDAEELLKLERAGRARKSVIARLEQGVRVHERNQRRAGD